MDMRRIQRKKHVHLFEFGSIGAPGHPSHQGLCLGVVLYAAHRGSKDQGNTNHQEGGVSLAFRFMVKEPFA